MTIKVLSGGGPCRVGLEVDGPIGLRTPVMAGFDSRFRYIGEEDGGAELGDAQPRTLPVVEAGQYTFSLFAGVPPGTTCEYKDRNLWSSSSAEERLARDEHLPRIRERIGRRSDGHRSFRYRVITP